MHMTAQDLLQTTKQTQPPSALGPLAEAMWWQAHGNWERAHQITQEIDSREAAWVHAFLRRAEGDPANARYWYAQAGQPECRISVEQEWLSLTEALLVRR